MSIPISGILLDPYGNVARFSDIKLVTLQGSGEVIETSNATFRTDENGAYAMDVQFGRFAVYMRFNGSNGSYSKIQAITVNSDTIATTLGELLAYTEPLTPEEILIVQALVNEAISARDDSEAFAIQSGVFATNSENSAIESVVSANAAANSVALLAPVPLNGGVWASGQIFNFYNEYMIYNGEAYSPLPATTLPYTVGAIPDLGFVYQIALNDHSKLANLNAVGGHDAIYDRYFFDFDEMLSYLGHSVGHRYSTGSTSWQCISISSPMTVGNFLPLGDIYINDFSINKTGSVDESRNLQIAIDLSSIYGVDVRLPAGIISAHDILLKSNTRLIGVSRDATEIRVPSGLGRAYGLSINPASQGSTDPANNIKDVYLADFHLSGPVAEEGFFEHAHLLNLNGFTGVTLERLKISGAKGDHIYIGAGNTTYYERYNYNFVARDLIIDGINNDNRNGISIITIDGFHLDNFSIVNCSRSDMPGAIDFEPNGSQPWYVVKNVSIRNGAINDCLGGTAISVYLGNNLLSRPENVVIDNIEMKDINAAFSFGQARYKADEFTPSSLITVSNCRATGGVVPIVTYGVSGVAFIRCEFKSFESTSKLGYIPNTNSPLDVNSTSFNLTIEKCTFNSCSPEGSGKSLFDIQNIDGLNFHKNSVINSGCDGYIFEFLAGDTKRLSIEDNYIRNVTAPNMKIAYHNAGGVTTETKNRFLNNNPVGASITTSLKAFITDRPQTSERFTVNTSPNSFETGISRSAGVTSLPSALTAALIEVHAIQKGVNVRMTVIATDGSLMLTKLSSSPTTWGPWF